MARLNVMLTLYALGESSGIRVNQYTNVNDFQRLFTKLVTEHAKFRTFKAQLNVDGWDARNKEFTDHYYQSEKTLRGLLRSAAKVIGNEDHANWTRERLNDAKAKFELARSTAQKGNLNRAMRQLDASFHSLHQTLQLHYKPADPTDADVHAGGPGSGCQGPNCGRPQSDFTNPADQGDLEKVLDTGVREMGLKLKNDAIQTPFATDNMTWSWSKDKSHLHIEMVDEDENKGAMGFTMKTVYDIPKQNIEYWGPFKQSEALWKDYQKRSVASAALKKFKKMQAGGPGSGCNPDVGRCGRPNKGKGYSGQLRPWNRNLYRDQSGTFIPRRMVDALEHLNNANAIANEMRKEQVLRKDFNFNKFSKMARKWGDAIVMASYVAPPFIQRLADKYHAAVTKALAFYGEHHDIFENLDSTQDLVDAIKEHGHHMMEILNQHYHVAAYAHAHFPALVHYADRLAHFVASLSIPGITSAGMSPNSSRGQSGWQYVYRPAGYVPQKSTAGFPGGTRSFATQPKGGRGAGAPAVPKMGRAPRAHVRAPHVSHTGHSSLGIHRPNASLGTRTSGHGFRRASPSLRPARPSRSPAMHMPHIRGLGEPEGAGNYAYSHIDPNVWFHPPSLRNKERVPTDDPGETNDKFLDVTKRKAKETDKFRMGMLKRSAPGGNPPQIPARTTLINPHMAVYMPSMFDSAMKVKPNSGKGMRTSYARRGCI